MSERTQPRRRAQHTNPRWFVLPAALGVFALVAPFFGMFLALPWPEVPLLLATDAARDALRLSLRTSVVSTALALSLGVPLAHLLAQPARTPLGRWMQQALYILITLPMVLPPVVAGLALLTTLGRRTPLGIALHEWGLDIAFTTTAVIVAQTFVAMPFVVISLTGALRSRGLEFERTARDLGANRTRIFWQITLPLTWPAVASGAALTLARSLGEFGATLTFAGSLQGTTRTLPLEIYLQREVDTELALALAVVLLAVAMVVIAVTTLAVGKAPEQVEGAAGEDALMSHQEALLNLSKIPCPPTPDEHMEIAVAVEQRNIELDLRLPIGAVTAVVGPNGAGKSTLLNVLGGAIDYQGTVRLPNQRKSMKVAWLHQRALLFPHMSVLQNVAFPLLCQNGRWYKFLGRRAMVKAARNTARKQLQALGCLHLQDRRPYQLSGGQAQRIAIARALTLDPDLVLLDEPLAAIDSTVAWSLRVLLRQQLRKRECTAVVVTHDLTDVRTLADHVVVMGPGRVAATGKLCRLLKNPPTGFAAEFFGLTTTAEGIKYRPEDVVVVSTQAGSAGAAGQASEAFDTNEVQCLNGTVVDYPAYADSNTAIVLTDGGYPLLVSRNAYTRAHLHAGNRVQVQLSTPVTESNADTCGAEKDPR